MSRGILGLDVGSYAIKAVELRQTLRELEVVQLRELPLGGSGPTLVERLQELPIHRCHGIGMLVGAEGAVPLVSREAKKSIARLRLVKKPQTC